MRSMTNVVNDNVPRWKIVSQSPYVEGRIDDVMQGVAEILLKHGYNLSLTANNNKTSLTEPDALFLTLFGFEKDMGVTMLLQFLVDGIVLEASKDRKKGLKIIMALDMPQAIADKEGFKNMIAEWVSQNHLTYMERFYRRPTLAQDPADRYMDNPLESSLKYLFGFAVNYRVSLTCLSPLDSEDSLQNALKQVMDGEIVGTAETMGIIRTESMIRVKNLYEKILGFCERFMPALTIGGLITGVFIGKYSEYVTGIINSGVERFIDLYKYIAPVAIFIILAPSLGKTFRTSAKSRFVLFFTKWYFIRKILACVWAAIFTFVVFDLPLFPHGEGSLMEAMHQTLFSLGRMMITNWYFRAFYLSVIVALISKKNKLIYSILDKTLETVEISGKYFIPLIPLFMVAIGTYIKGLPAHLGDQFQVENGMENLLRPFSIWGLSFNPRSSWGMIWIYVFGAFLVGFACFIWHSCLLVITKIKVKKFSLRSYFLDYWIKVYPLLWSTSSESIAMPLNLYLVKRYAWWVRPTVRRFAVGVGSYMNINGTLICVFVLGGMVSNLLGIRISFVEWLMAIPVIVLISYGVPGIPGELVLFAGPIATLLALPSDIKPVFIAVYIGLQIGLPDSFRTGNNSTDNHVCAILLNEIYEKKFYVEGEEGEQETAEIEEQILGANAVAEVIDIAKTTPEAVKVDVTVNNKSYKDVKYVEKINA